MVLTEWRNYSEDKFEDNHPDIGGKTFSWVYRERSEFVKFVLIMYDVTGTYKKFQDYCKQRNETFKQKSGKVSEYPTISRV